VGLDEYGWTDGPLGRLRFAQLPAPLNYSYAHGPVCKTEELTKNLALSEHAAGTTRSRKT